ncbi:MAG: hypothetical protein IPH33_05715 [Bacteroidetes bacterium]|nr:hypothetical protein [Bacteroidota bacterium]
MKININHTAVGDLAIFLQSSSGEVLGLSSRTGNSSNTGNNFVNTIFSDIGAGQLPTTGAPYTGTYKPWTSTFTSCVTSTKTTFTSLGGGSLNPNGNWRLWVYDRASGNSGGTIVNWTITFPSYSVNSVLVCDPVLSSPVNVTVTPNPVISFTPAAAVVCSNVGINISASGATTYSWSPATGLNTTIGSTVFANPTVSTTYTVTGTISQGCSTVATIPVSLFSQPSVSLSPLSAVCVTTSPFSLTGGSPLGGVYSGVGVSSGIFDPSVAGVGSHLITYTYTDGNGCSALATQSISVTGFPSATISPAGPISLCLSSSATLSTISGYNYLWSTGATTQSINVNSAGNYSVVVSDNSGCVATSSSVVISNSALPFISTVFSESMGTVPGTTQIATHESGNGFDNDGLTMSGTGDVRVTSVSSGYIGATGGANIFLTNTAGKNFIISGINTIGLTNLELSFGIVKSTTASNGSDLLVQYSTDGINYTSIPYTLATGAGTAVWTLKTVTGIPSSATLSLQFIQTGMTTQYRIDDVILKGEKAIPELTASGNTNLCQGNSVVLNADPGSSYIWDDGQTTQSISVSNSSIHSCLVTSVNGCSALSELVNITSNPELFTLSGGGNYCTGETAPSIILSGSQVTVNYQLKHNLNNVGPIVSGTGFPIDFGTQSTTGTYTVIASDISTSCTATMMGSVIVNENSLPGDFSITGNSSFCSGSSGTLLGLSGSEAGVSYQLKLNGSNSGVEIAGTGSAISFGNKDIVGLYTVVATNISTLCTASMTGYLSLIQNTSPSSFSIAGGGGYCQGGSGVNITLANSQSGVNYSLYNSSGNTGINFNGTGAAISFGNSTMPDDYYIIGTDLSNGCQSAMTDTITVSLLPLPIIYSVTGGGSFCSVPDLGVAVGLNNSEMV